MSTKLSHTRAAAVKPRAVYVVSGEWVGRGVPAALWPVWSARKGAGK